MFQGIYTSSSHFFGVLLIACCIVFFSFIVKFLSSNIGAIYIYSDTLTYDFDTFSDQTGNSNSSYVKPFLPIRNGLTCD